MRAYIFRWIVVVSCHAGVIDAAENMLSRIESLPDADVAKCRFLNPKFAVFRPSEVAPAKKLPLVVYLHGAGGRGDNVEVARRQAKRIVELIDRNREEPFLAVAPQCPRGTRDAMGIWQPKDLEVFLEHVLKTLPVDADRIYLTGNSMGGYGTWAWAATHPERFAAIAPVAGGLGPGGPKDVTPNLDMWAKQLIDVPVWTFHGAEDRVVPPDRSRRMVAAIKKHGGQRARMTIYPDVGHGSGQRAFADPKLYEWMFAQRPSLEK